MINYLLTGFACGLILSLILIFISLWRYKLSLVSKAKTLEPLKIKNKEYYVIDSNKYLKMETAYLISGNHINLKNKK